MKKIFSILAIVLLLFSCSPRQDNEDTVYYIIKHPQRNTTQDSLDNTPPPPTILPVPYYGQLNFIILDTLVLFHQNYEKLDFGWCGSGIDFSKPPRLGITPDSLTKLKVNKLHNFLTNAIPDSIDKSFFPCISSPTDTIKNIAFKIITDIFKERKIVRCQIRNWTEEEKYVVTAKIENKKYNPDSVDWKIGFGGIVFIPPTE